MTSGRADARSGKWEFLTPGSLVAAVLWIAASALFAIYTATFGSYDKTWGALSAVIVMLTWLWLTGMALGAEINAEAERSGAGRCAKRAPELQPQRRRTTSSPTSRSPAGGSGSSAG